MKEIWVERAAFIELEVSSRNALIENSHNAPLNFPRGTSGIKPKIKGYSRENTSPLLHVSMRKIQASLRQFMQCLSNAATYSLMSGA